MWQTNETPRRCPHPRIDAWIRQLSDLWLQIFRLQLLPPADTRSMATADYLFNNCLQKGCFFQDMIHSGINIYMTLELAQVFLRAGDLRFRDLLKAAISFASPTGQWPEAIHPATGGRLHGRRAARLGRGPSGSLGGSGALPFSRGRDGPPDRGLRAFFPEWLASGPELFSYGPIPDGLGGPVDVCGVDVLGGGHSAGLAVDGLVA